MILTHLNKLDISTALKTILYTDPENGQYYAPLAILGDKLRPEMEEELKFLVEAEEGFEDRFSLDNFALLKSQTKEHRNRAI